MRLVSFVLLLSFSSTACFRYMAMDDGASPEPGQEVRVRLVPPQSFTVGRLTRHEIETVEGEIYRSEGESVGLWSKWFYDNGGRYDGSGAVIYIPRNQIDRIEARRMETGKTVAAIAGTSAVIVAIFELARRAAGGGAPSEGEGGGGIQSVAIPLP